MMNTYVAVRPVAYGDEKQVKKIVTEGTLALVNAFFVAAITKETTMQMCVILSALFFIIFEVPLYLCWISCPITAAVLYGAIYLGHWYKILSSHKDLDNLDESYLQNPRCGFWVAEAWERKPGGSDVRKTGSDVTIVSQDTIDKMAATSQLDGYLPRLVGTVAITVKRDPDMKEPPTSVGFLRRMYVRPPYRHKGIGQHLGQVAYQHCVEKGYRAVELITTQCHYSAKSFYEKQEWTIVSQRELSYLGGLVAIGLYSFRKPCIRKQDI